MRSAKKLIKGISANDWITIGISVFALFISSSTAYYTLLRETDDIRIVAAKLPSLAIESDSTLSVGGDLSVVFINSGNRPAIILGYAFVLGQEWGNPAGCGANAIYFETQSEPLVLKQQEIVTALVKLKAPKDEKDAQRGADGAWMFPVQGSNIERGFVRIQMCLQIDLSTPSHSYERVQITVAEQNALKKSGMPVVNNGEIKIRPMTVIRKSGTIFNSD